MKERKIYVCDFCNTSYNEKSKAEKCESNHKKCKEIVDVRYSPYKSDNTGRPKKIALNLMMEIMNGIQECKEREISRGENNMQNKYSRKQLEELYNCKIFKTTTCNEDNYVFWAAQGLPFTENGEDRLFGDACGWDLDELHEDIRNAIRETCIVFDA